MGFPLTGELGAASSPQKTAGKFQRFEGAWDYPEDIPAVPGRYGASAYYSKKYGSYFVGGTTGECYERLGGTSGKLGFPTSNAVHIGPSQHGTKGLYKSFEGGRIFTSKRTGAHPVWDAIGAIYDQEDVSKRLGFPISDEVPAKTSLQGATGVYQRFEGGQHDGRPTESGTDYSEGVVVYCSQSYGAFPVWGGIRLCHEQLGGTGGPLGFPISMEREAGRSPQGTEGWFQCFEGGIICWSEQYGGIPVVGAISTSYNALHNTEGQYGFPKAPEEPVPDHPDFVTQEFEGGMICTPSSKARRWKDMYLVVDLIHWIYEQIFHRRADESGLVTYGGALHRGEKSVKDVVLILAHSEEYKDRCIKGKAVEDAVDICIERLRGCAANDSERDMFVQIAQTDGFDRLIDAIAESEEYRVNFGEDDVPQLVPGLAVASTQPGHLECFYRGQNNHLWHRWWKGASWSQEEELGGLLKSAPAAISSREGNRIDCFYRGQDNHLLHRWWDGTKWSREENLGGFLTSAPTVASLKPDHLDCYYRGGDANLWHREWDGIRWSEEERIEGWLTSAPAAISGEIDRIDCFYRGGNNALWHRWWNGSHWSEEEEVGGILA